LKFRALFSRLNWSNLLALRLHLNLLTLRPDIIIVILRLHQNRCFFLLLLACLNDIDECFRLGLFFLEALLILAYVCNIPIIIPTLTPGTFQLYIFISLLILLLIWKHHGQWKLMRLVTKNSTAVIYEHLVSITFLLFFRRSLGATHPYAIKWVIKCYRCQ